MTDRKKFDMTKSNVSAELKAQFQETSTRASPVSAVPGVGSVTKEKLAAKDIRTVGDLVDKIESFDDLNTLVSGVNRHRIFDCLEVYLKDKCAAEYEDTAVLTRAIEKVSLVDESKDEEVAENVSHCNVC